MSPLARRLPLLYVLVATASVLAGCAGGTTSAGSNSTNSVILGTYHPPQVQVAPADKATQVPLDTLVTVTSSGGDLTSVTVTEAGANSPVAGKLAANKRTWTAADGLDSGASYSVDVTAIGPNNMQTTSHTTFTALTASDRLITSVFPDDGTTVGVGMPIKLRFNTDIPADQQQALIDRISVTADPPVDGAWHWFAPSEVHYRPSQFWASGTKVTLSANFKGVNAGNGIWGQGDWTSSFTVGDKHVTQIDDSTHTMQVYSNDQLLYTFPVSMGIPSKFPTISGTLVVWSRIYDVYMDSRSIGIPWDAPGGYHEHVFWDTAISTDGFFIHAAPWSVWAQGNQDVSHGCVNLSTDRATTFYNFSRPGDVVIIKNTRRNADASDGEGDWQIPFDQYANSGGQSTDQTVSHNAGGA